MDAKTFLDNFGTIAEAPGGVDRLRELMLDLAVHGRLVPQQDDEASASTSLEEVAHNPTGDCQPEKRSGKRRPEDRSVGRNRSST